MTSNPHHKDDLTAAVAALIECKDRSAAAKELAPLFATTSGANTAIVYLFADEDSAQLVQAGGSQPYPDAPTFADEMELMTFAQQAHCDLIPIAVRQLALGHVLLTHFANGFSAANRARTAFAAAQSAIALALLRERERSSRGAMKDPSTNAYTFAYFVDIARREIDRARRHERRCAFATITSPPAAGDVRETIDLILGTVRGTDVLARADNSELYLFLPETGGLGAQAMMRRLLRVASSRLARTSDGAHSRPPLTIGVATYPHDGPDLSRLLRTAKRRADASQQSAVHALQLESLSLARLVDRLLDPGFLPAHAGTAAQSPGMPRPICLSSGDTISLSLAIVREALRGGPASVTVAQHPQLGLGSSLRTAFRHDHSRLSVQSLDLSSAADCANIQFLSVIAEHGAYLLLGRLEPTGLRAIHASNPSLVDLVALRACQAVGVRLLD